MTDRHPPVSDWATDFDHTDPAWIADPFPIWDELRQSCPVAHSPRYGGTWLPLTHELVSEVAYDHDRFTSRSVVVTERRPGPDAPPAPIGLAPPITSDPPFHAIVRRMLIPAFAPKPIAALEPFTRELCRELLAATAGSTEFDAATEYAQHIPVRVIIRFLGFPQSDADLFRYFIRRVMEDVDQTPEERDEVLGSLDEYMDAQIEDHRAHPRDDLTSFLCEAEINGEKLSQSHIRGTMVLLMIAGIDTSWSAIGASLWHLARNVADRRRLAVEPGLMDTALEELLRAYAPVTMARLVAKDCDFHGYPLKAGDWLLLPFPAANRDPGAFPDADRVLLDRAENRHAAFGLGRHRCLGSNLARMELRVALEEWLARYPDFELADPAAVAWSGGQIRGPRQLPIRILLARLGHVPNAVADRPVIHTEDLTKVYPGTGFAAVDKLNLNVQAGEIFGLLGPNGAGKTTTAGMLTTRVVPTEGRAFLGGIDVARHPALAKQLSGIVSQQNTLDRQLTVWENLYFHGRLFGIKAKESRRIADELLDQFQLSNWAKASVYALSGGMAQRLMVARAIFHRPSVLFLDEPTAGLDPQSRLALWELLGELHRDGQTILLTTHYMEEADRLCHRVAIMDHGRILALDTPAALKQSVGADTVVSLHTSGDTVRLGELLAEEVEGVTRTRVADGTLQLHVQGGDRLVPRIVLAAERGGFDLVDVSVAEPTLETVFISLTGKELRD